MSKYREENQGVVRTAYHANCWIRLHRRSWFTPAEFAQRWGEKGATIKPENIEILNPLPFVQIGRQAVIRMVQEKRPTSDIVSALERLYAFEDKVGASFTYRPGQADKVEWPRPDKKPVPIGDRVRALKPDLVPDYNDLSNELTEKALETADQKTQEVLQRKDKFTRRY